MLPFYGKCRSDIAPTLRFVIFVREWVVPEWNDWPEICLTRSQASQLDTTRRIRKNVPMSRPIIPMWNVQLALGPIILSRASCAHVVPWNTCAEWPLAMASPIIGQTTTFVMFYSLNKWVPKLSKKLFVPILSPFCPHSVPKVETEWRQKATNFRSSLTLVVSFPLAVSLFMTPLPLITWKPLHSYE